MAAVAQVVGSVGMLGVIWIIQVVHYPLMRFVSAPRFARFETAHRRQISLVVGPLMAVEGVCVLAFLFAPPPGLPGWLPWAGRPGRIGDRDAACPTHELTALYFAGCQ